MTTFIQAIALAISIIIIILVVKWQVDDDINKMEKRLDDTRKEINNSSFGSKNILHIMQHVPIALRLRTSCCQ